MGLTEMVGVAVGTAVAIKVVDVVVNKFTDAAPDYDAEAKKLKKKFKKKAQKKIQKEIAVRGPKIAEEVKASVMAAVQRRSGTGHLSLVPALSASTDDGSNDFESEMRAVYKKWKKSVKTGTVDSAELAETADAPEVPAETTAAPELVAFRAEMRREMSRALERQAKDLHRQIRKELEPLQQLLLQLNPAINAG